jgi:hypothetical protein
MNVKIVRLRRAAEEWGDYDVPIQERRYVPFNRRSAEPTTVPALHERIAGCLKRVDYQLYDRNYIRWVHGTDVAKLGKEPEKRYPPLTRVYNEKFDRVRTVEELASQRETVEFLLAEYEAFPPSYPGGYSALRLEYPVHLEKLDGRVERGRSTVSEWLREGFPNRFLAKKGVNALAVRRDWGAFAARKLAPIDGAYASGLRDVLVRRGRELGCEREARAVAALVKPYALRSCPGDAVEPLPRLYETALASKGVSLNGERGLLEQLDCG